MDTEKAESLLKEGGRTVIEYNNNNNSSSNTEGAEDAAEEKEEPSFSEWQIRLGGNAAFDSRHYRGCDFRNHDTGESILPAEVYMNLFQQVGALKSRVKVKMSCLFLVLYLAVIISPLVILNAIIDDDSANDNALTGIAVAIAVMAVAFAIGKPFTNRIYKTLDSQAQALVDERRDEFLETYGIDLGYQCHNLEKNRLFNDNSRVWLRRPRQEEEEEEAPAEGAATALSSSVAPPEAFPPIYLTPLVPGEIHILEARYHSSIGLDKETWTLIQNTHKETMQKVNPTMRRVALLFSLLMIPYAVLAPVIASYIGVGGYWCGLFLYFGVMYVLCWIVKRQYLQAQKQVAETVTRILLLNNNDEEQQDDIKDAVVAHVAAPAAPADGYAFSPTNNLAGCYSLLFLESPLEGRLTSTRYQLVRTRTRPTSDDDEKTVVTSTTMDEEDQATSSLEIV